MRSALRLASVVLALLLLSACGPVLGGGGGADDDGPDTIVPAIGDVEAADDPKGHSGAIDINLPEVDIEPVVDDPRPKLPATVTDAQGTRVTVTDTSRILALDIYGTLAQTVFELGLGDHVVGRDISANFPAADELPLVTSNGHELNAEAILALDPTVVLTDTSLGPWNVVLQLKDAGIPVVVTDSHRGMDNLTSLTMEVADALGVRDAGKLLSTRIEDEVAEVERQIDEIAPGDITSQLRTIFLYVRGQAGVYYLFGEDSGADALIEAAGGYDVSGEIGWKGMRPVTDEAIINAQPDAIVMMREGLKSVDGVDGLLEQFPALALTPAGENERVIAMDDGQVLSFGPRTPSVLNALAVALYAPGEL